MDRIKKLMELYKAVWISADFECDLEAEFPVDFKNLKWNENKISDDVLSSMYSFMEEYPF